jgi:hypothetical protein
VSVSVLPPPLKEKRSDEREVFGLVNALRRIALPPPGVILGVSDSDIVAFTCIGRTIGGVTVTTAKASGSVFAIGVLLANAVALGLAAVVQVGLIRGAVSGRVANDPVWVGPAGSLVFAAPGVGNYAQVIGTCVNATDVFVHVDIPVI